MATLEQLMGQYNASAYSGYAQQQMWRPQGDQSMFGAGLIGAALSQQAMNSGYANAFNQIQKPKERTLFQEVKNDVTSFIKDHRGVIYFVALALLIDHFLFKGVFKTRLQGMLESLIAKVETKVSEAK